MKGRLAGPGAEAGRFGIEGPQALGEDKGAPGESPGPCSMVDREVVEPAIPFTPPQNESESEKERWRHPDLARRPLRSPLNHPQPGWER